MNIQKIINNFFQTNSMTVKNLFSVFAATVMMAGFTPAAMAQTQSTSVINSGDNASINSSSTSNSSTSVSNSNTAKVAQDISAQVNTGNNSASKNIGGGMVQTGDANLNVGLQVQANQNQTQLSVNPVMGTNATDVVNTGDHTSVNTNWNANNSLNVSNNNKAFVGQNVYAKTNTGGNSADSNIGGAMVQTGGANFNVGLNAALNSNATGVGGMQTGEGMGFGNGTSLTNTGDHAHINTNATSNNSVDVYNSNYAGTMQNIWAKSNTGWNSADSNIGGAHVMTGPSNLNVGMQTTANSNVTGISGTWMLSPMSANLQDFINTGDNLHASTNVTSNNSQNVYNTNRLYDSQHLYTDSQSGWNSADSNIGGMSHVMTGPASFNTGMFTRANSNMTSIGMGMPTSFNVFGL